LAELIKALPPEKYELYLLVKELDPFLHKQVLPALKSLINLGSNKFSIGDLLKIRKIIHQTKPDIVHAWSTLTSHFAAFCSLTLRHDFILINGAIRDSPSKKSFHLKAQSLLLSFYKNVIANSHAGLKAYSQAGKRGRSVIYNGISPERNPQKSKMRLREKHGFDPDIFIVTMAAKMEPRKDFITFIESAEEILKEQKGIKFLIIGTGSKRGLVEERIKSSKFRDGFNLLGERNDVEELLKLSDISVLLSSKYHGEGIANILLESMIVGTPLIATDSGGTEEIIIDHKNGIMTPVRNSTALTENILLLKNDIKMRDFLTANGIRTIQEKFSQQKITDEYTSLYTNVLNQG